MKFSVLTLFPDFVNQVSNFSIIKRAVSQKLITLECINIRNFTNDKYQTVDDKPYGGGAGMVMKVDILHKALLSIKIDDRKLTRIILLDPRGERFTQKTANNLINYNHIILICGHYEAIDERITKYVDEQISIGDFILTGGELPAMTIIDSVSRLVKGVINENSLSEESRPPLHLEYPQYTRPEEYDQQKVPGVLLSGDHQKIEEWKKENSKNSTD